MTTNLRRVAVSPGRRVLLILRALHFFVVVKENFATYLQATSSHISNLQSEIAGFKAVALKLSC